MKQIYQIQTTDSIAIELTKLLNANTCVVFVAKDNQELEKAVSLLSFFKSQDTCVFDFPAQEIQPFDISSIDKSIAKRRCDTLIQNQNFLGKKIIVTTLRAFLQKTVPADYIKQHEVKAFVGKPLNLKTFITKLTDMGYNSTNMAENVGEFAQKGSIIDICTSLSRGVRISLDDEIVESIKIFSTESQSSTGKSILEFSATPCCEIIANNETMENFKKNYKAKELYPDSLDYEMITSFISLDSAFLYLPLFYNDSSFFTEYLKKGSTIVLSTSFDKELEKEFGQIFSNFKEKNKTVKTLNLSDLYISSKQMLEECMTGFNVIALSMAD